MSTATTKREPDERTLLTSERVRAALVQPELYPHHPAAVDVRETHISWVFLAGEFAYKLKKPLVLDFLDYGTAARRREMCHEEVRLNRRLAPDLYVGVRGVALSVDGGELTAEDDPRAVDYVVEMRRYDETQTLSATLERGELHAGDVAATGRVLAGFHDNARRVSAGQAPVLATERRFGRNLHELLGDVEQRGEIGRVQAIERFAHAFVSAHAQTLIERANRGLIRDGHGDLRAEHVLLGDGIRVVDCVEFDRELRELDVADDLAFLVIDLAARGGERFGAHLVQAYRAAGGDPGPDVLIAFYAAYRALVRAKVALVRAAQLPAQSGEHGHQSAHARDLIALAERFTWRARVPLLLVVCGVPASGKRQVAPRPGVGRAVRAPAPQLGRDPQADGRVTPNRASVEHDLQRGLERPHVRRAGAVRRRRSRHKRWRNRRRHLPPSRRSRRLHGRARRQRTDAVDRMSRPTGRARAEVHSSPAPAWASVRRRPGGCAARAAELGAARRVPRTSNFDRFAFHPRRPGENEQRTLVSGDRDRSRWVEQLRGSYQSSRVCAVDVR